MRPFCRGIVLVSLLGLAVGACTRPRQAATPAASPSGSSTDGAAAPRRLSDEEILPTAIGMVSEINVLRVERGLPPLAPSGALMALAITRADSMAEGRYLGHEDPSGQSPAARDLLAAAGMRGPVAELVYGSQGSLDQLATRAVHAWQSSPANRDALLSPDYAYAGVGVQGDETWWKVSLVLASSEP